MNIVETYSPKVVTGCTIHLTKEEAEKLYKIVGYAESNPGCFADQLYHALKKTVL